MTLRAGVGELGAQGDLGVRAVGRLLNVIPEGEGSSDVISGS